MKRLWLVQLVLIVMIVFSDVSSKGIHKDKENNPDVLKEFRSFADSVIPEEKAASRKAFSKPRVKDPAVYIDEPERQVTRKVTFTSNRHNTTDDVGKILYPSGPSTQRDDTNKNQEEDDDEVDTYIDEKEEYKSNEKHSVAKKKHPSRTKAVPNVQAAGSHIQPTVATIGRVQVKKESKPVAPAVNASAPSTSDLQQCISTCPATCAPECTPQCCTQETAPPPVKKVHAPPTEKPIRWFERPRYEPGPNIPPPIFPEAIASNCGVTCTRSCTPSCKLHGCCKVKTVDPVIGCSKQCTPNICSVGCPAHCCARYITSVDPAMRDISI